MSKEIMQKIVEHKKFILDQGGERFVLNKVDIKGGDDFRHKQLDTAFIKNTTFEGSDMEGVKFPESQWDNTSISSSGMRYSDHKHARFNGVVFTGVDLFKARFENAVFKGCVFEKSFLKNARFSNAYLSESKLEGCDLSYATLKSARLDSANLYEANLTGADLTGADLRGAILRGANLTGADLTGALMEEVDLEGANLDKVVISATTMF